MRLSAGKERGEGGQAAVHWPDQAGASNFGGAGPMTPKFCAKIRATIRRQRVATSNCSAFVSRSCNQPTKAMILNSAVESKDSVILRVRF